MTSQARKPDNPRYAMFGRSAAHARIVNRIAPCRTGVTRLAIRETISELQSRFGVGRPADLSIHQASELIDALKEALV